MNRYQKICAAAYCNGEYHQWPEGADSGDTLFDFLMRELSNEEGCDDLRVARARIACVLSDVKNVYAALERAEEDADENR